MIQLCWDLPNITGDAGIFLYYGQGDESFLYQGLYGEVDRTGTNGNQNYHILFDASRSTYIFGNSTSVQPAALCLLPCIKT